MAGSELGSLYYDLNIDDKNLGKQLDSADKQVKEFGKGVSESGEQLKKGLIKTSAGFAVVGAGLTLVAKNATDFTTDLVKSSAALGRQLGISTIEASRLVAAMGRLGIDSQKASQMFGIFSKQIVASTENAGKAADAFSKLGVSTTDATGKQKDFNTLLFEVSDKFKAMPDGIDKTALAMELFGKQGKDMIKVLNLGSDGIKNLEKRADELGLTLNEKTIGSIRNLVESQKKLKESTDSIKIAIGSATAPVLTKFNEKLNQIIQNLLGMDGPVRDVTVAFLAFGGPVFTATSALLAFLASLIQVWPALVAATSAMWAFTASLLANPVVLLATAIVGLGVAIAYTLTHMQQVGAFMVSLADRFNQLNMVVKLLITAFFPLFGIPLLIMQYWTPVTGFFANILNTLIAGWNNFLNFMRGIAGGIAGVVNYIKSFFNSLPSSVSNVINNVIGLMRSLPSRIVGAVGNLGSLLWNAGAQIIQGMINGVTSKINALTNTIRGAANSAISAAKGVLGIRSPSKVFEQIGKNVTEGFTKGIENSKSLAVGAIDNLNNSFISPDINAISSAPIDKVYQNTNNNNNASSTVFNIDTIQDKSDAEYIFDRINRNAKLFDYGVNSS